MTISRTKEFLSTLYSKETGYKELEKLYIHQKTPKTKVIFLLKLLLVLNTCLYPFTFAHFLALGIGLGLLYSHHVYFSIKISKLYKNSIEADARVLFKETI